MDNEFYKWNQHDLDDALQIMLRKRPDCAVIWGLAFAFDSTMVQDKTMTEVADEIGVTRAAISANAREIINKLGIEPPPCMKSKKAVQAYRKRQLKINKSK